jgi:hypothetical protein
MSTYRSDDFKNIIKLTPIKAIKKFVIAHGIKPNKNTPIYYAWESERQPKWIQDDIGIYPEKPYFTVDFDMNIGEWYVGYITNYQDRKFATIDDITGRCDIYFG